MNMKPEQGTALYDQANDGDEIELLSDRELLLSIAKDINDTKELIRDAVVAITPLLNDPKLKLIMRMFR